MKRNLMSFEAPPELTEQVKRMAKDTYTNTSAICRQALAQYINQKALPQYDEMVHF